MNALLDKVNEAKRKTEEKLARGGGGTSGVKFWKPEAGENKVRIMPPWSKEDEFKDQFWREVAQHWNVSEDQKGPVLCPAKTPGMEGPCPICEFVEELKKDKTNVEAQKLAKDLRAKTTYLLNVVALKDPVYTAQDVADYKQAQPEKECPFEPGQPKIQIYACPVTIFDQILGLISSSGQDLTSLEAGRDLTIKKIPNKDRFKTRYEIYPAFEKSESEVSPDTTLPLLDKVGFEMEYEKMVDLLQEGAGGKFVAALPSGKSSSEAALPADTSVEKAETVEKASTADLEAKMREELGG